MANGLVESRPNSPLDPSLSLPSEPTQPLFHDVILDQTPLRVFIVIQGRNVRIIAKDKTGNQVGLLEAETDLCNGGNPRLKRVECPDIQPGTGYMLLCEIHQLAETKGGTVSYSDADASSRRWLTNNGLTHLLETPATPNI